MTAPTRPCEGATGSARDISQSYGFRQGLEPYVLLTSDLRWMSRVGFLESISRVVVASTLILRDIWIQKVKTGVSMHQRMNIRSIVMNDAKSSSASTSRRVKLAEVKEQRTHDKNLVTRNSKKRWAIESINVDKSRL